MAKKFWRNSQGSILVNAQGRPLFSSYCCCNEAPSSSSSSSSSSSEDCNCCSELTDEDLLDLPTVMSWSGTHSIWDINSPTISNWGFLYVPGGDVNDQPSVRDDIYVRVNPSLLPVISWEMTKSFPVPTFARTSEVPDRWGIGHSYQSVLVISRVAAGAVSTTPQNQIAFQLLSSMRATANFSGPSWASGVHSGELRILGLSGGSWLAEWSVLDNGTGEMSTQPVSFPKLYDFEDCLYFHFQWQSDADGTAGRSQTNANHTPITGEGSGTCSILISGAYSKLDLSASY